MAKRRSAADSQSLALFEGSAEEHHQVDAETEPGLGPAQQDAADAKRVMLVKQPMQTVAIRPTRGELSRPMTLLWLKIMQEIQRQSESSVYNVPLVELADFVGDRKNYDRLKANLRALNVTQVEWNNISADKEETWVVSTLLAEAEIRYRGRSGNVEISLGPKMDRGIRQAKQFSMLNLMLARELVKPGALHLYRIAVAYQTNPSKLTGKKSPIEWESILKGVPLGQPREKPFEYKYFKRDTLDPAMKEINRLTDLTLVLREDREGGRSVRTIQFEVHTKAEMQRESGELSPAHVEAFGRMKEMGVRTLDAKKMLAAYGVDRVHRNLNYVQKIEAESPKKIRSRAAYICKAIQDDYAEREMDGSEKKEAARANAPSTAREIAMEQYRAFRRQTADSLFGEMPRRESEQWYDRFLREMHETKQELVERAAKTKGLKSRMVLIQFQTWLAEHLIGPESDAAFTDFLVNRNAKTSSRKG